jgi:penicillin-binding protein 1A
MESLLIKIFATMLALSQVTTAPEAVKTEFNRDRDQQQVAQLLRAGCIHMIKAFDVDNINFDELIATALDDPQAMGESKAFRGINFTDLQTAYRQFCKDERSRNRLLISATSSISTTRPLPTFPITPSSRG